MGLAEKAKGLFQSSPPGVFHVLVPGGVVAIFGLYFGIGQLLGRREVKIPEPEKVLPFLTAEPEQFGTDFHCSPITVIQHAPVLDAGVQVEAGGWLVLERLEDFAPVAVVLDFKPGREAEGSSEE
jgi:hypothetical protein